MVPSWLLRLVAMYAEGQRALREVTRPCRARAAQGLGYGRHVLSFDRVTSGQLVERVHLVACTLHFVKWHFAH